MAIPAVGRGFWGSGAHKDALGWMSAKGFSRKLRGPGKLRTKRSRAGCSRRLVLSSLRVLPAVPPHGEAGHARTVGLLHAQDVPVDADLVAGPRGAPQVAEDEAAYGAEVLALEARAQRLVDRLDRDAAVHRVGAVRKLADRGLLRVELVADLADDLLDDVLHRDQPLERAPSSMTAAIPTSCSRRSARTWAMCLFSGTTRTSRARSRAVRGASRPPSSTARITSPMCTAPTILSGEPPSWTG